MAYSPDGVLGMMWRTNEVVPFPALSPYSIWAASSDDGGRTFDVLRVSRANSPAPAPGPGNGTTGDDLSYIALDRDHAYVVWADWRPGERNVYFSAVKLQAFDRCRRG
jgi:hypothetical protein